MDDLLAQITSGIQDVLQFPPEDRTAIEYVMTTTFLSIWHKEPEPVWGYLVGPPGCGKTELLRTLDGWASCVSVDELTENALASGKENDDGSDASLLPLLNGRLLVVKDFSSFSAGNKEQAAKILSVLRSAYDGAYTKSSGAAGLRSYACKFGMLAATVPSIDTFLAETQRLGERFLLCRMNRGGSGSRKDRLRRLQHARDRMADKPIWRARLGHLVQTSFDAARQDLQKVSPSAITIPPAFGATLDELADLTARLRSVPVNGSDIVEPENGNRIVQQLTNLARSRAALSGRHTVHPEDVALAQRVAFDTLPVYISRTLRLLAGAARPALTLPELTSRSQYPLECIQRLTRQYRYAGILRRTQERFALTEDAYDQIQAAGLFPAES